MMTARIDVNTNLNYEWAYGEDNWNEGMDANLLRIARLAFQPTVKSAELATIPASPAAGDIYIVPSTATGTWASYLNNIAAYDGSAWSYYTPKAGYIFYCIDKNAYIKYSGTAWSYNSYIPGTVTCQALQVKPAAGNDTIVRAINAASSRQMSLSSSVGYPIDGFFHLNNAGAWDTWVFQAVCDTNGNATSVSFGGSVIPFYFAGQLLPGSDNTLTLGSGSYRWSTIYAATGTINTSDAREKTAVSVFTENEIGASIALAKEIGSFKFLDAVYEKGNLARKHIGMTVQRAIEILDSFGLNPFEYGFICFDKWDEGTKTITKSENDFEEIQTPAGSRYSFRTDELLLFIARGFEARLTILEAAMHKTAG
jgi:hypothetical protein